MSNGLTHSQLFAYLEYCQYVKRMTEATIVTKRKAIERFLKLYPELPDFALLTNSHFDRWRASLAREGKSGKTVNNYADHVLGQVRWLKVQCKTKVLLDFDLIERAEEDDPEIIIFTEEEIAKAIAASKGRRDELILCLAFQSGLRLTEMATLKVENIEGLSINVMGKNRHRRRTFIREDTKQKLEKWLLLNDIDSGYVFPSPTHWGKPLSNQMVRDIIRSAFKRAGVTKRAHPHALRHTWFTLMLDSGAPLMDTAIIGGHSDPKTTKRYYHASPKRHGELHAQFIPQINELSEKTSRKLVDKRHQELY